MEKLNYNNVDELVAVAEKFHGHLCAGITIGVRMAMAGLREIGISDPMGEDRKKLIIFTEIDRCASDAIMCLTGCRPGKRSMKVLDYGKMAVTFINLETGKAVRLVAAPPKPEGEKVECDFKTVPEPEMFNIQQVKVQLAPCDLPGKPLRRATCAKCGESVMDGREVVVDGKTLCKPCAAQKSYYTVVS